MLNQLNLKSIALVGQTRDALLSLWRQVSAHGEHQSRPKVTHGERVRERESVCEGERGRRRERERVTDRHTMIKFKV